jgi:hypothetical protein
MAMMRKMAHQMISYTTIQAETDGGVIIDGENVRTPLYLAGNISYDSIGMDTTLDRSYIKIKGIIAQNSSGSAGWIQGCRYIKIINCGFNNAGGNAAVLAVTCGHHILIEGCYAWGTGRYKMGTFHSYQIIFRNCVARHDRVNSPTEPMATYGMYSSRDILVQNCIDIDSDQLAYYSTDRTWGAFWAPNTSYTELTGVIKFDNCITLNNSIGFASSDITGSQLSSPIFTNVVGWDITPGNDIDIIHSAGNIDIQNSTIGQVSGSPNDGVWLNGWSGENNTVVFSNNVVYQWANAAHTLFYGLNTATNNNIYDSGGSPYSYSGELEPSNTKTYSPLISGLTYLVKTETGSTLKTDGIGANILYLIGTSGTLYGETGYATETAIKMWPFPNEELIRSKMAAYTWDDGSGGDPEITGARGAMLTSITGGVLNYLNPANPIRVTDHVTSVDDVNEYIYGEEGGETDEVDPIVAISDSNPKTLTSGYITTLGFTSSDANGIDECKWRSGSAPDESNGTACTGTTSGTCSVTGLVQGNNSIYVGCADPSNNWGNDSITVNAPSYRAQAGGAYNVK